VSYLNACHPRRARCDSKFRQRVYVLVVTSQLVFSLENAEKVRSCSREPSWRAAEAILSRAKRKGVSL